MPAIAPASRSSTYKPKVGCRGEHPATAARCCSADKASVGSLLARDRQARGQKCGRRPLKLVRHMHGTTFYHKGRLPPIPDSVHQYRIAKREGGEGIRLWVDDLEGLLGLVSIGTVELHAWNATVDNIEHADMLVFDLDPGSGIEWTFVTETALVLRDVLKNEGFTSWPKVTGGKGVHVMVPVEPQFTHDQAHRYCRNIAQRLAATEFHGQLHRVSRARSQAGPAVHRLPAQWPRHHGSRHLFPRVHVGFPIAAPVTWKQIERGIVPDHFSMAQTLNPRR